MGDDPLRAGGPRRHTAGSELAAPVGGPPHSFVISTPLAVRITTWSVDPDRNPPRDAQRSALIDGGIVRPIASVLEAPGSRCIIPL